MAHLLSIPTELRLQIIECLLLQGKKAIQFRCCLNVHYIDENGLPLRGGRDWPVGVDDTVALSRVNKLLFSEAWSVLALKVTACFCLNFQSVSPHQDPLIHLTKTAQLRV